MLGITNHWAVLIAHRVGSFKEFYYLDSKNINYINWGEAEIEQYLDKRNAKRIREGRTPLTTFQRFV